MENTDCRCEEHKCYYKQIGFIEKIMSQEELINEQQMKLDSMLKTPQKRVSNWRDDLGVLYSTDLIFERARCNKTSIEEPMSHTPAAKQTSKSAQQEKSRTSKRNYNQLASRYNLRPRNILVNYKC